MNPFPSTTGRRVLRVRHEPRLRELTVARVETIGAGFVGVQFIGDDLADFVSLSFDDHVKLMLPAADGEMVRRDYTPRRFDAARRELTLEFALHGAGPAADWARRAAPGQRVQIGGPRGSMIIPADYDWHLLAGDATALPAIHRRLEELPAGTRVLALVQVDDPADRRRFDSAADLTVQWVQGAPDWLAALQALELPAGEGHAWCAGEAGTMAAARDLLLRHHGQPSAAMRVAAYWKRGAADFHETLHA